MFKEHSKSFLPVPIDGDIDDHRVKAFPDFRTVIGAEDGEIIAVDALRELRDEDKHVIAFLALDLQKIEVLLDEFIEGEIPLPKLADLLFECIEFDLPLDV